MGGSNSAEAKEDEDPPINVDTGDSVKVKQTLDGAVDGGRRGGGDGKRDSG